MIIRVINKQIAHSKSRLKQDTQRPPEHLSLTLTTSMIKNISCFPLLILLPKFI